MNYKCIMLIEINQTQMVIYNMISFIRNSGKGNTMWTDNGC